MKKLFVVLVVVLGFICLSTWGTAKQNISASVSETSEIQPTKLSILPSLPPTIFNAYTPILINTITPSPPTPTIEANTYYDRELKVKISYPKDWVETSKGVFIGKNGYVIIKKLENYHIPDLFHTATDFANTVYSKYKPQVYCVGYSRNGCAIAMRSPDRFGIEVNKVISLIPYYRSKEYAKYFLIETTEQYFRIIDDLLVLDSVLYGTPTDSKDLLPIPTLIEVNFREGLSLHEGPESVFNDEADNAKGISTYTNCGIENNHRNSDFSMSNDRSRITIKRRDETIFEYASPFNVRDNPWSFCTWDNNWMMETYDIVIINGQVLNHKLGFDRVFGWHMLGGKQIYFVERNNKYQISFDGKLIPVKYNEIFHYGCCGWSGANPKTNGVKTWFLAKRDSKFWFTVVVNPN